jgi:Fe-S-cluster containining protein
MMMGNTLTNVMDEERGVTAEDEFDCGTCGACCREAFHVVELEPDDPFITIHPALIAHEEGRINIPRPDGLCVALERVSSDTGIIWSCRVYCDRPISCREFELGSANCVEARARVGINGPPEIVS